MCKGDVAFLVLSSDWRAKKCILRVFGIVVEGLSLIGRRLMHRGTDIATLWTHVTILCCFFETADAGL